MIEMKRRDLLSTAATVLLLTVAGCADSTGSEKTTNGGHTKELDLSPTVTKTPDGWSLTVIVGNEHNWHTSFHGVQVLAFTADGTKICEADAGDLLAPGDATRTVKMTCSAFPAIVTATARETPCDDARLQIVRWAGAEAQRRQTVEPGEVVWEYSYCKCGEQVPPKRVLGGSNDGGRSTGETSTDERTS